jgi:hypothetical protein
MIIHSDKKSAVQNMVCLPSKKNQALLAQDKRIILRSELDAERLAHATFAHWYVQLLYIGMYNYCKLKLHNNMMYLL